MYGLRSMGDQLVHLSRPLAFRRYNSQHASLLACSCLLMYNVHAFASQLHRTHLSHAAAAQLLWTRVGDRDTVAEVQGLRSVFVRLRCVR